MSAATASEAGSLVGVLRERLADPPDVIGALFELRRVHEEDVRRFAAILSPADADDICDATWDSAERSLPGFKFQSSPRTWLLSIAYHRMLDIRRGHARRPSVDVDRSSIQHLVASVPLGPGPRRETGPETNALRAELTTVVQEVLRGWEELERTVFLLHLVLRMTYDEIIESLELQDNPRFRESADVNASLRQVIRRLRKRFVKEIQENPRGLSLLRSRIARR